MAFKFPTVPDDLLEARTPRLRKQMRAASSQAALGALMDSERSPRLPKLNQSAAHTSSCSFLESVETSASTTCVVRSARFGKNILRFANCSTFGRLWSAEDLQSAANVDLSFLSGHQDVFVRVTSTGSSLLCVKEDKGLFLLGLKTPKTRVIRLCEFITSHDWSDGALVCLPVEERRRLLADWGISGKPTAGSGAVIVPVPPSGAPTARSPRGATTVTSAAPAPLSTEQQPAGAGRLLVFVGIAEKARMRLREVHRQVAQWPQASKIMIDRVEVSYGRIGPPLQPLFAFHGSTPHVGFGQATTADEYPSVLRGTVFVPRVTPDQVLDFLWNKRTVWDPFVQKITVVSEITPSCRIELVSEEPVFEFHTPRDYCTVSSFRHSFDGIVLASTSVDHVNGQPKEGFVRACMYISGFIVFPSGMGSSIFFYEQMEPYGVGRHRVRTFFRSFRMCPLAQLRDLVMSTVCSTSHQGLTIRDLHASMGIESWLRVHGAKASPRTSSGSNTSRESTNQLPQPDLITSMEHSTKPKWGRITKLLGPWRSERKNSTSNLPSASMNEELLRVTSDVTTERLEQQLEQLELAAEQSTALPTAEQSLATLPQLVPVAEENGLKEERNHSTDMQPAAQN